jgi:hypothetical protein
LIKSCTENELQKIFCKFDLLHALGTSANVLHGFCSGYSC